MSAIPDKSELLSARERIGPFIHRTPVLTSQQINKLAQAEIFFKCENFQRMGAFKMRGAANAIQSMSDAQQQKGVVTHSSGNFAQAVALSAKLMGLKAFIVMPENAPVVKRSAVAGYGGTIITSGNSPIEREKKANEARSETGATFVHPSDDIDVILGNSTSAQELIEDVVNLDMIIAPVGGGGLIAGTALAAKYFSPYTKVIGAEPTGADDAFRSLRDGVIYPSTNPQTICDGLRTYLGQHNFPVIQQCVDEIILVDDVSTINTMRLIYERLKIVVEPSSAIVLAAVMDNPMKFAGRKIGLIISGGNVDLTRLGALWSE